MLGILLPIAPPSLGQPVANPTPRRQIQRLAVCPRDIETLTSLLLRDLPGYANRAYQRSRHIGTTRTIPLYIVIAGRAEFEPLTLGPGEYRSSAADALEPPDQLFFTTLERQYTGGQPTELQHYHWLFLVYTEGGWRLAMMYSRLGSYPSDDPPTPPRESSNGIIGQAVQTWLRDCRAGAVRSP